MQGEVAGKVLPGDELEKPRMSTAVNSGHSGGVLTASTLKSSKMRLTTVVGGLKPSACYASTHQPHQSHHDHVVSTDAALRNLWQRSGRLPDF